MSPFYKTDSTDVPRAAGSQRETMIVASAEVIDDYQVEVADGYGEWMIVETDDIDGEDWQTSTILQSPTAVRFNSDVELIDTRED